MPDLDTQTANQPGTPAPAAPAATPAPDTGATAPSKEETPRFFFRKAEAEKAEEPDTMDPAKLPPDLQKIYKSMQADYTRKTQAVAEDRRKLMAEIEQKDAQYRSNQEKLISLFERQKQGTTDERPTSAQTLEQIKQLRAEGNYDEADTLYSVYVDQLTEERLKPIQEQAAVTDLKTTFNAAATTALSEPLVKQYAQEVVAEFDNPNDPTMNFIRQKLVGDKQAIQTLVPVIFRAIAGLRHAAYLEQNIEKLADTRAKEIMAREQARARGVPAGHSVQSQGVPKSSGQARMGRREAIEAAVASLSGG